MGSEVLFSLTSGLSSQRPYCNGIKSSFTLCPQITDSDSPEHSLSSLTLNLICIPGCQSFYSCIPPEQQGACHQGPVLVCVLCNSV